MRLICSKVSLQVPPRFVRAACLNILRISPTIELCLNFGDMDFAMQFPEGCELQNISAQFLVIFMPAEKSLQFRMEQRETGESPKNSLTPQGIVD